MPQAPRANKEMGRRMARRSRWDLLFNGLDLKKLKRENLWEIAIVTSIFHGLGSRAFMVLLGLSRI
jgi:hypothetical protein